MKRPSNWKWALLLLVLIPLEEVRPGSSDAAYDRAYQLFVHGYLHESQLEAERGYLRSRSVNPQLAAKFQLLEAQAMLWGGFTEEAVRVLSAWSPHSSDPDEFILERTVEGAALNKLQRIPEANRRFSEAESLCARATYSACADLLRAQGVASINRGDFTSARHQLLASLSIARSYHDRFSESTVFLNLGAASLQSDHFDEAVDWSNAASKTSLAISAEDVAQNALGNLGWAYFNLGDSERALQLFHEAEKSAINLGDPSDEVLWVSNAGYIYQQSGDLTRASQSFLRALELANSIKSREDIVNSLEDLAHLSVKTRKLDDAETYVTQVKSLVLDNRVDVLDVMFAEGQIAAARHKDQQAEAAFRTVEHDPASQSSMKLDAEHRLALLYERQGNQAAADRMYRTTLATFESARDQIKKEDSEIPFVTNATAIYGDYIRFLVAQGKSEEALRIADQGRAQTLEQGLGLANNNSIEISNLKPTEIARKTNATLLFYWLGENESYLWAIDPRKITLFPLPPQRQITQSIEHYRKALLGLGDPAENSDPDGLALYRLLIAPAAGSLPPGSNVIVLGDGALSQLNFETLIVPSPHPHYWIEDATVASAPSLHLLAASAPSKHSSGKLLLIGNAISPNVDYPELPEAASEMNQIRQAIATQNETVYSREKATPSAYLDSAPATIRLHSLRCPWRGQPHRPSGFRHHPFPFDGSRRLVQAPRSRHHSNAPPRAACHHLCVLRQRHAILCGGRPRGARLGFSPRWSAQRHRRTLGSQR